LGAATYIQAVFGDATYIHAVLGGAECVAGLWPIKQDLTETSRAMSAWLPAVRWVLAWTWLPM